MSQPVEVLRRRSRVRPGRLALAGVLSAGALVVVPVAQADSLMSVRSHVHGADAALHQVVAAASAGSVSGPLAALEAQLRAAGVSSAKLYRHAHTKAVRVKAATALTKIAAQENRDAQILTPLVGQLTGSSQVDLASFVAGVTQGREQSLTLVSGLLSQLPAGVQAQVAGVVAELSGAGTGQVGQLAGAISPGSVACPAIDAVSQVVASVLASVPADLGRFQSLLSLLPASAQTQLQTVLGGLPDQLNSLVASLKQAFDCTASSTTDASGGRVGTGPSAGSLIGSITQFVSQLIQSLLPTIAGTPAGTPSTVPVPGPIAGLLGQLTSLLPGLGELLGGSAGGIL